ncbi:pyridoxal-phosphate dependent enzyme [Actinomadura viridis]|uniref:Threonine synthase n=1 Tax=Actinomadura viridis TaxID=58110 RepID=A0A931DKJ4_9ACTN|nr:pyridoxal-phosphate dependent enzyme [Actinomadura viridis]MBG6091705.1 threonine synthase [Actinomadura viridis]
MTETGPLAPLRCPRCGRPGDPYDLTFYRGCPDCRAAGTPVNYVCEIPPERVAAGLPATRAPDAPGLWRWHEVLPVDPEYAVSLGEGGTPLLPLPRFGERIGVPRLYLKNESANPTWSHKDRLAALSVAAARAAGATTITAASTGNHGAALAAYAGRAGLRCVIFTMATVPETMKTLMLSYGAEVIAVPEGGQRYVLLAEAVEQHGWYPASNGTTPPVGSTPYGVDGYKTIAYELYEQLGGRVPDVMVLPVAYGDCMSGLRRGFADLRAAGATDQVPRLVGAEVFTALADGLAAAAEGADRLGPVRTRPTAGFSIAGTHTTHQAIHAAQDAVTVGEDDMLSVQRSLAATEGVFGEASSAAAVAAATTLARTGRIAPDETVVCLLTSSGLKDPAAGRALLPDVPVIDVNVTGAERFISGLDRREPSR